MSFKTLSLALCLIASMTFARAQDIVTLFGPQQFCLGIPPGGGGTCITIPENCFATSPIDNVVPATTCTDFATVIVRDGLPTIIPTDGSDGQTFGPDPGPTATEGPDGGDGGQTFGPDPGQTFGPDQGQAFGPDPGQTFGPDPGQTFGPDQGQTFGPDPGPTLGPDPGQTFSPDTGPAPTGNPDGGDGGTNSQGRPPDGTFGRV